jgi:hypothetical protein
VEQLSSGGTRGRPSSRSGDDELLTTGKSRTTNRSRDPGVTPSEDISTANGSQSTHTKKWKRRYETYMAEPETATMLSQVIKALAASIDSGDSFTQLATEEIHNR